MEAAKGGKEPRADRGFPQEARLIAQENERQLSPRSEFRAWHPAQYQRLREYLLI